MALGHDFKIHLFYSRFKEKHKCMKTRTILLLVVFLILFIGLNGLLLFYFKVSYSAIGVIIASGFAFGIISASYKNSSGQIFFGRLLLSNERLIFLSARDNECLYDPKLTEIIPTIERSKFLKIPRGLNLLPNETKIYVRFPNYWLKAIENEKTNATQ